MPHNGHRLRLRAPEGRRRAIHRFAPMTVALVTLVGVALAVQYSGYRVQHTGSLPRGIYRTMSGPPTRGTIGMWCLPLAAARLARTRHYVGPGPCPGDAEPVGKIVLAAGGDTVVFDTSGAHIAGRRVPNTRPRARDTAGRPLTPAPYRTYVLRRDEVWLWSPYSTRSFDSRYFGPVSTRQFLSALKPVWVRSMPEVP